MVEISTQFKVERQSLASEVAKRLSRLIQDGTIPPGTRLVEADLANQLGVSRGPVREALRILEATGLAEAVPGKGSYTATLSKKDAQEIYMLRILLEQEAVVLACQNASAAQLEEMESILGNLFEAAENKAYNEVAYQDIRLHRKIWEAAGNRRLEQVLDGLIVQARRYLSLQTMMYESTIVGVSDHRLIMDAIKQRDCAAAREVMRQHLVEAAEAAAKNIHD
ncbi:MAG: GntR family transcriptional regulator [Anaerolineae bacterium]|nr:GntR family transcriptional regulator [Anaerolineae bacterium]